MNEVKISGCLPLLVGFNDEALTYKNNISSLGIGDKIVGYKLNIVEAVFR